MRLHLLHMCDLTSGITRTRRIARGSGGGGRGRAGEPAEEVPLRQQRPQRRAPGHELVHEVVEVVAGLEAVPAGQAQVYLYRKSALYASGAAYEVAPIRVAYSMAKASIPPS